jgi:hypothetical protein
LKPPALRVDVKLKLRGADTYNYNGDDDRDLACKDLQERFGRRFPGLLLVWDEANRNTDREWQKFTLKEAASNQKIRLVFVTNDAFENDEMGSFLIQFEDHLEEFAKKSQEALRFRMGRFEKQ